MDAAEIKTLLSQAGASASGIARVEAVDADAALLYNSWISAGRHGTMEYLEKYPDIRRHPAALLEGAASIIVAAFSYNHPSSGPLRWARYSLGRDYHEEVRERLSGVAGEITASTGETCRVAVDTAPLRERYWAVKAGLGFTGLNGLLIVPGSGSWVVLGEIITTLPLTPDTPLGNTVCDGCRRCVEACPEKALDGFGGMDSRQCRSYLTIEYRGDRLPRLGDRVYGCDICQEVCPHNRDAALSAIPAFAPRKEITSLGLSDIIGMEQQEFSRIFSHSAIKRTKLSGLRRNALRCGTERRESDFGNDTEPSCHDADRE